MFGKILKTDKHAPPSNLVAEHWTDGKENRPRGNSLASLSAGVPTQPWVASTTTYSKGDSSARVRTSSLSASDRTDQSAKIVETHATNRAFERMLDELQIPSTLRPKLSTLDTPIKAAMLKSSHVLNIESPLVPPNFPVQLRKSSSSASLDSQASHARSQSMYPEVACHPQPRVRSTTVNSLVALDIAMESEVNVGQWFPGGASASVLSLPRSSSSRVPSPNAPASITAKSGKDKDKDRELSPAAFCMLLKFTKSTDLPVEKVKKLRLMLRNESAGCVWGEPHWHNIN